MKDWDLLALETGSGRCAWCPSRRKTERNNPLNTTFCARATVTQRAGPEIAGCDATIDAGRRALATFPLLNYAVNDVGTGLRLIARNRSGVSMHMHNIDSARTVVRDVFVPRRPKSIRREMVARGRPSRVSGDRTAAGRARRAEVRYGPSISNCIWTISILPAQTTAIA